MPFPALRTLSTRIILGFAVLIVSFSAVSALTVLALQRLGTEVQVIRIGYLPLALTTKDLYEKQKSLHQYLRDLEGESSTKRVKIQLGRLRVRRMALLNDAEADARKLRDSTLPPGHGEFIDETMAKIAEYRKLAKQLDAEYKILAQYPPLYRVGPTPGAKPSKEFQAGLDALAKVRKGERQLVNKAEYLRVLQRGNIEDTTRDLERNASQQRSYTLYLGLIAVALGLLITVWATLTLRPLRRLRDAAQRIASGDYASRIAEAGPAEVADLAKEFNAMSRAVEERERELVRTERLAAVGKMAAMITHEVRNPLSSIALNTELLEEEMRHLPDEQQAESLALCRAITKEIDRLTALTEEYLQFARLPKPKLQQLDINPIVRGLVEFERRQLVARGVKLHADLAETLPPVRVDDSQLRQALLNLVRNAADELEQRDGGGNISVSTRATSSHVEIRVVDDGPGIPEELAPRLFDPFVSGKKGGTGLGLALTQQIMLEHGGSITVDSEPGKGATFLVSLPRVEVEADAGTAGSSTFGQDPGKMRDSG